MASLSASLSFPLGGDSTTSEPVVVVTPTPDVVPSTGFAIERDPIRRDLRLDPATGDLDLSSGDADFVANEEAIAQALTIGLSSIREEWFLDLDAGLPVFEDVLVESPNEERIRGVYRSDALDTPGVVSISQTAVVLDRVGRVASVELDGTADPLLLLEDVRAGL